MSDTKHEIIIRKVVAIITAAGKGERMNSPEKKQFILLGGKPIIIHTIKKFLKTNIFNKIHVTINPEDRKFAEKLFFVDYKLPEKKVIIVDGGKTRQQSVLSALEVISSDVDIVVIHDGVRPFIKIDEIIKVVDIAFKKGAVTLACPVKNTIKSIIDNQVFTTLNREQLWEIFTPQAFKFQIIYDAHKQSLNKGFFANDDAELVEKTGSSVFVVKGSPENIKITDEFDLKLAKAIVSKNINNMQKNSDY